MNNYDIYIYLIFSVKIVFIIMAILHLFLRIKGKTDSELDKKIVYWKERMEFIFTFLMSILLMYLFNPRKNNIYMVDKETNLLLFLFGLVLLITAKWSDFFHSTF